MSDQNTSEAPAKKGFLPERPPRMLFIFAIALILLVCVLKFLSCSTLSKIDQVQEVQNAQNPPQVQIQAEVPQTAPQTEAPKADAP